jgi:ABC-type molybdenum transport system ATPase subunit/photorepair protein PhrA
VCALNTQAQKVNSRLKELPLNNLEAFSQPASHWQIVGDVVGSYSDTTLNTVTVPKTIRTISGTVNVNSSIFVVGTGTKFNIANNLGLLTVGSYIAINSETRIVDSIVSNTQLTVSVPFTITANNQELVVINTVYEAIATEVTLDEIIAENELVLTIES